MKRLLAGLCVVIAGVAWAIDYVSVLPAGSGAATTATITNASTVNPVWITGVSVNQATGAADATNTVQLLVTKSGVDFEVATVELKLTDKNESTQLTHPVRIAPGGAFKVTRTAGYTNQVVNVLVTAKTNE
jgi:hypothetical protein